LRILACQDFRVTTPGLGLRIKQARGRKHLTQRQLADLVEVDRKTIDNWENERTTPGADRIAALEVHLGSLSVAPSAPDPVEEAVRAISAIEWLSPGDKEALIAEYRQRHRPHRAAG
jgi:transcriptional regulator with XRE-family HTH domain